MEKFKQEILTVEAFLEERPDMECHTELAIQSAIYTSASLINSFCNGKVQEVWDYYDLHKDDPTQDTTNPLYRTPTQLSYLKEAFVFQTQYTLNIGNDFSQGGGSYSIGNVNSSFSRPIDRDVLAPAVDTLLQKAGVYQLQSAFSVVDSCSGNYECVDKYDCEPITRNIGDNRYVLQQQTQVPKGYIPMVDTESDSHMVVWTNPDQITENFAKLNEDNTFTGENTFDGFTNFNGEITAGFIKSDTTGAQAFHFYSDGTRGDFGDLECEQTTEGQTKFKYTFYSPREEGYVASEKWTTDNFASSKDLGDLGDQVSNIQSDVNSLKSVQRQHSADLLKLDNQVAKNTAFIDSGYLVKFKGAWANDVLYDVNDYVEYNNQSYLCIQQNENKRPDLNVDFWKQQNISQSVDLNNYYTKQEIDNKLQNYAELNGNNEFIGDNTFSGTNTFNNALACSGNAHFSGVVDFNNNAVVITPNSVTVNRPAFFTSDVNFTGNIPTWNGNPLVYSSQLEAYALKSQIPKLLTIFPNAFKWVATNEDYGWSWLTKYDYGRTIDIYGFSVKWKTNASNNFKMKCKFNVWNEGTYIYFSIYYNKTGGSDEYGSVMSNIDSVGVTFFG